MKRVVYRSRATRPMSENELVVLLVQARDNNARAQITGMLLYCDGVFLQCLEGPEYHINDLMDRLVLDLRHADIEILSEGPIAQRRFDSWTMGFRAVSAGDVARVLALSDLSVPLGGREVAEGENPMTILDRLASEEG